MFEVRIAAPSGWCFGSVTVRLVQFTVVMINTPDNSSITPSNVAAMTEPTNARFPDRRAATLCVLGVLGVQRERGWEAVRGALTPMFLAALGLAGDGGVGSEELIETIWPSPDQPATARQSLANIVLRLRQSHGAWFVESTRRGYRLGSHVQSDRQRFLVGIEQAGEMLADAPDRALELVDQALALWRGEPWVGIERPVGVEADRAAALGRRVGLAPNDPALPIEALSGGNQQKVVVGRWLETNRRFLIAEDPTAGVDVGAKAEIYHLLFEALAAGTGILIVSTDFEEVAAICHRAIVFSRGGVVAELAGVGLSTGSLIQAASGNEAA